MRPEDFIGEAVAAWVDRGYDRDRATDDGIGRYGAYLRDRLDGFRDCDFGEDDRDLRDRVVFAQRAWAIANGPIMEPALVLTHPRVGPVTTAADDWDYQHLLVTVEVLSELPAGMYDALGYKWGGLDYSPLWGWRQRERSRSPQPPFLAVPRLDLSFPIVATILPSPPPLDQDSPLEGLVAAAYAAVDAIVTALNRHLQPVLALLDPPGSGR
jgi:hypothetical protein